MLKATYLLLTATATGILIWQFGGFLGIPGTASKPDVTITLSALAAGIIFLSLWFAGRMHKKELKSNVLME